jgi:protein gp37
MEINKKVEAENNEGVQERGGEMRKVKRELNVKREMWIGYTIGAVEVIARRSTMMRITEIKRGPYDIKRSGQGLEI